MQTYSGVVKKGKGRAAALGYPTANIHLEDPHLSGIYSAYVLVGDIKHEAAVFADSKRKLLEAHLLDFSGVLDGKEITITLLKKIRESERFADDAALRAAIADDIKKVRDEFARVK